MANRVSWIDICKGIGILTVLYAHALNSESIRFFFYSFHIPLFFFLSGVVFHHKNHESLIHSIKKAVNGILIPYFIFALIGYLIWMILNKFSGITLDSIITQIQRILYGNGSSNEFFYNVVLWFLPCLFITRILFTFIVSLTQNRRVLFLLILLSGIVGYLISILFPLIKLPFGFETALSAVVFFGLGYLWNSSHGFLKKIIHPKAFKIFLISLGICVVLSSVNYIQVGRQIDMRLNFLNHVYLYYPAAISGIISCVALSHLLEKNRVLEVLGKYSMILFIWHLYVFTQLTKFLLNFISPTQFGELRNVYFAPLFTLVTIGIILILNKFYIKTRLLITKN